MAIASGEVQRYQREHTISLVKQIDAGIITIDEDTDGDAPMYIVTVESE
jgi:hypothetical protein